MEKKILFLVFCLQGFRQLAGLQKFGQKIKKWLGVGGNDTFYFLTKILIDWRKYKKFDILLEYKMTKI